MPQSGQLKFWLNINSFSPKLTSTIISPSDNAETISNDSVNLFCISSFTTSLSTIISILCFLFFSNLISSDNSYNIPSARTLTYPLFFASSNSFMCSPFLPLTMGASNCNFERSGNAIIWSAIWSIVCFLISFPHLGQ